MCLLLVPIDGMRQKYISATMQAILYNPSPTNFHSYICRLSASEPIPYYLLVQLFLLLDELRSHGYYKSKLHTKCVLMVPLCIKKHISLGGMASPLLA